MPDRPRLACAKGKLARFLIPLPQCFVQGVDVICRLVIARVSLRKRPGYLHARSTEFGHRIKMEAPDAAREGVRDEPHHAPLPAANLSAPTGSDSHSTS